jgi:large subunit ribosomal protein L10
MALKIEDKKKVVVELSCYAHLSSSAIVANCNSLSVNQVNVLRRKMHELGMYLKVVRNTLLKTALVDTKFCSMRKILSGSVTIIFSPNDPVVLSKAINKFAVENENFKIKHFSMLGKVYDASKVKELSFFPSLGDSLILLCNALNNITAIFLHTLNEIPMRSVRVLSILSCRK